MSGILLNPMAQVRASAIVLRTAAAYLHDPRSYDPEAAWKEALEEAGEGDPEGLELFARAHRFSPLWPDDREQALESGLERLRQAVDAGGDPSGVLAELRELIEERLEVGERVRKGMRDTRLIAEIAPWLASHRRETRRIEAALQLLETLFAPGPRSAKMFAFFGFEGRLALEPETGKTSYGPRRVLYPQLASMHDESMSLGQDPALIQNRCLADEFVSLAEGLVLSRLGARPRAALKR